MVFVGILLLVAAAGLAYAGIEDYQVGCLFKGRFVKRGQGGC